MSIFLPPTLGAGAPLLGSFPQRVYDQLEPLQYAETDVDFALAWYVSTLSPMFDEIDGYASDGPNGEAGWSSIMDVDRAPSVALPWLAQFVGVTVDQSLSDTDQRNQIKSLAGFNRGTPAAIVAATQKHLTGARDVIMIERFQGSAYKLYVATRTSQTPSPTTTLADMITQKPAGIVPTYETLAGQTFAQLLADSPLMSNVFGNYATFQGALTGVHGT